MDKQNIIFGVVGLLLGALIAGATAVVAVNNDNHKMTNMMGMNSQRMHHDPASTHSEMSMSSMTEELKTKSGDEFDKAFVEMMIAHHEGAIEMALLIPERAKHEELKKLGSEIVTAQSKEIMNMKQWQVDWGYSSGESMQMMHGGH
jgi:uncharacterized protein (DUF305 family)